MMFVAFMAQSLIDPIRVTPDSFTQAREPQIAIDMDERVYIAYGMGNVIYVSSSADKGNSYGAPIKVGEAGKLSLGMRRGPRIAAHKGVLTISAAYGVQGRGRDEDLVSFTSRDKGKTWTVPIKVNDVSASAREGLHAMAIAPDGTLACTWLDLRDKGTKLYVAVSKDGGAKWSENRLVYASPSGTICECCHPSMAFDSKGKLYVMFRNLIEGARDMYLTSSSDLRSFSPATKLGEGAWILNACPMDGGMLGVDAKGIVGTIWRREGIIFSSQATGIEKRESDGRNPWMAMGADGAYFTWQNGKEVVVKCPGVAPTALTQQGLDPVISVSGDGKLAIAAWNENGIRAAILK